MPRIGDVSISGIPLINMDVLHARWVLRPSVCCRVQSDFLLDVLFDVQVVQADFALVMPRPP